MRPEHKKYILEHIGKRSVREIAGDLGIRERNINKYLEMRGMKGDGPRRAVSRPEAKEAPLHAVSGKTHMLFIIGIFILVFAAYSGALNNDFIWDDEFLIRDNTAIHSFSNAISIFKTYLAATSGNINVFYRPIQELSYMVDYRFWGDGPFGFHLTNVVLHALCAVALYLLSLRILKDVFAAFVTAALFGLHPINTEAVTYVAGRADPLFLLFLILSFILFLKSIENLRDKRRLNVVFYLASISSYALAILSKEIGLILPLLLLLYIFTFLSRSPARNGSYFACLPFGLVALLYVIARKTVLDFSGTAPSFIMGQFNLGLRLLTTCKAVSVYLALLTAPLGLHMERKITVARSLFEPGALVAVFVMGGLTILVWRSYRYSKRFFFAAMWFIIGLLPVSNIVPINSFIAEHWLYLPAIGVFMIVGMALAAIFYKGAGTRTRSGPRWGATAILIMLAVVTVFGVLTFERNKDWKDEITFFKNTLKYSPRNARLHLNFGNTYHELRQADKAMEEYGRALELEPNYAEAHSNIGSVYLERQDYQAAAKHIEKALSIKPNLPQALAMLRVIRERQG